MGTYLAASDALLTGMAGDGSVVAVVELWPRPGREVELRALVERNQRRVAAEAGCASTTLTEGGSGELVLVELWTSLADLTAYVEGQLFATLLESYTGLLARAPVPRVVPAR
jgi:quinol monooxygenase YgiN